MGTGAHPPQTNYHQTYGGAPQGPYGGAPQGPYGAQPGGFGYNSHLPQGPPPPYNAGQPNVQGQAHYPGYQGGYQGNQGFGYAPQVAQQAPVYHLAPQQNTGGGGGIGTHLAAAAAGAAGGFLIAQATGPVFGNHAAPAPAAPAPAAPGAPAASPPASGTPPAPGTAPAPGSPPAQGPAPQYEVHHFYSSPDIAQNISILDTSLVDCNANSTASLCVPNTYPICLSNGTIMCVSHVGYTFPCNFNASMACVLSQIPCAKEDPTCNMTTTVASCNATTNGTTVDGNNATTVVAETQSCNATANEQPTANCSVNATVDGSTASCNGTASSSTTGFKVVSIPCISTIVVFNGNYYASLNAANQPTNQMLIPKIEYCITAMADPPNKKPIPPPVFENGRLVQDPPSGASGNVASMLVTGFALSLVIRFLY